MLSQNINDFKCKIDTGFRCNAKCYFCYNIKSVNDEPMDLSRIKFQILKAKEMKFKKVEFSGGESSYHPDFIKMIEFASSLGLQSSTLSNGLKFKDIGFLKECREAGLNEILFSVHGFKKYHDLSTGVQGSFDLIIESIKNSLELNIKTRINTTVTKNNIYSINELTSFLLSLSADQNCIEQFNFLPINSWSDADKVGSSQQFFIKNNLHIIYQSFDNVLNNNRELNIRYLPYCWINQKYHKYIKNHIHHFYDKDDWFPYFMEEDSYHNKKRIKAFKTKNEKFMKDHLEYRRNESYYYEEECNECLFKQECDGFKKRE